MAKQFHLVFLSAIVSFISFAEHGETKSSTVEGRRHLVPYFSPKEKVSRHFGNYYEYHGECHGERCLIVVKSQASYTLPSVAALDKAVESLESQNYEKCKTGYGDGVIVSGPKVQITPGIIYTKVLISSVCEVNRK